MSKKYLPQKTTKQLGLSREQRIKLKEAHNRQQNGIRYEKTLLYEGQGYLRLLDVMGASIDIVNAARVSLNKYSKEWSEKDAKLLKFLVLNAHTSPLEMVEFKFEVFCPLPIARQWFRHRSQSFNELSRRYTSEGIILYQEQEWRAQSKKNLQASMETLIENDEITARYIKLCSDSENLYNDMLDAGICREQARYSLLQSMMTKFIAKVDGNNLMKFVILRLHKGAQKEIREYAEAIVEATRPFIKEVWEELGGMGVIDIEL